MKIVISAWPGSGGSTLVILLANVLGYKVVFGSEMFRYIARNLKLGDTGVGMVESDEILQKHFAPIYNKFITEFIKSGPIDDFIIDTDLISFNAKEIKGIYSIFLHSDKEERKKRFIVDGRAEDVEVLDNREKGLREDYLRLCGIDFFDLSELKRVYDLVLDNSKLTITEEITFILEELKIKSSLDIANIEEIFWEKRKKYFINNLKSNDKIVTTAFLFNEMKKKFDREIGELPSNLRDIINKISINN